MDLTLCVLKLHGSGVRPIISWNRCGYVPRPALPAGSSTLFSSLRESVTQNVFGHVTFIYFIFARSSIPDDLMTLCIALLMETPGTHSCAAIRCTESLVPQVLSTTLESISYNHPITKMAHLSRKY